MDANNMIIRESLYKKVGLLSEGNLAFRIVFLILFLIYNGLLTGCRQNTPSNKQVFAYNEATGIATLDPAFAKNQSIMWPVHQLYNTLVEIDSGLNIIPSLAKSWEISSDRRTYTFHLRTGVFFHDNDAFPNGKGRAFTAQDVAYIFPASEIKQLPAAGLGFSMTVLKVIKGLLP